MNIKLGYQIPTGEQVDIALSHLIVCGITQLSGKTTCIEALITRSGKKVIVFKTKIGEKSFEGKHEVIPFFKDRSDYEFVRSLIEAYSREKLFIEKGTLMELCKGSRSLQDIKKTIDNTLLNAKLRMMEKEIYIRLQHYLENLIPQLNNAHLSKTLVIGQGVNVMNLEKFSEEVQSLIIQSVLDEVLKNHKDTIVVIPEAWKFVPQKYNNPCKRSVEAFIRQGAASGNYLFMDSQDLAGVDKLPLKQVSTYCLGYQAERNEVKHTLDQIPLPDKMKPKEVDIMTLKIGQFYLANSEGMKKVYVQPLWLGDDEARMVAMGTTPATYSPPFAGEFANRVISDTGGKVSIFPNLHTEKPPLTTVAHHCSCKSAPDSTRLDYLEIQFKNLVSKLENIEKNQIGSSPVYMVSPLEKIQKDFQTEAKGFILGEIAKLDDAQKKILKFVEVQGKGCSLTMIVDKCLYLSATSGGTRDKISKEIKGMEKLLVARRDKNNVIYPNLKEFIKTYAAPHGITEKEIQQVYDHIMMELV